MGEVKILNSIIFLCNKKNKNGKSNSCLEMSNSLIENARTSKFENVCFCGLYIYNDIPIIRSPTWGLNNMSVIVFEHH